MRLCASSALPSWLSSFATTCVACSNCGVVECFAACWSAALCCGESSSSSATCCARANEVSAKVRIQAREDEPVHARRGAPPDTGLSTSGGLDALTLAAGGGRRLPLLPRPRLGHAAQKFDGRVVKRASHRRDGLAGDGFHQ